MDKKQIVTVDLGNSYAKIGWFINSELTEVKRVSWEELMGEEQWISELKNNSGIFSSVLSSGQNTAFRNKFPKLITLDDGLRLPLIVNYETPGTLGKDRICNAVGAWAKNPGNNSLVVDVGTCIKFDFISADGAYQGGSISPGMRLRYQSLNDYTANLPLLDERGKAHLVGKSTKKSVHSGVMNGMNAEMLYLIAEYEQNYDKLTIFVTGGDAKYFDLVTKNNIFANENLTLEGLYKIFLLNAQ